jgi:hypothetical protein
MAFIDGTALSVALPALQTDLKATGASLLWVTNGFLPAPGGVVAVWRRAR